MPDTRVYANGYINIWVVPENGIANPAAPTPAEINAGVNISEAVAWDGTTVPTMSESSDMDDRSILDAGNARSRGLSEYEGSLQLFTPKNLKDTASTFGKTFQLFKIPEGKYWIVVRVLQNAHRKADPAAAGQYVSVFKVIASTYANDVDGEDSYKYNVELLPQGRAYPDTIVKTATPVTVTNATGGASVAVGKTAVLRATLGTHRVTQLVTWTSSDPSKATVSPNGVVKGIAVGTAEITASHPSASTASTPISITVAAT